MASHNVIYFTENVQLPAEFLVQQQVHMDTIREITAAVGNIVFQDSSESWIHGGYYYSPLIAVHPVVTSNVSSDGHDQEFVMVQTQEEVVEYCEVDTQRISSEFKCKVTVPGDGEDGSIQFAPISLPPSATSSFSDHSTKDSACSKKHDDKNSTGKAREGGSSSEVGSENREQNPVMIETLEEVHPAIVFSPSREKGLEMVNYRRPENTPDYSEYPRGENIPPEGLPCIDLSDPKQLAEFTKTKPQKPQDDIPRTVACRQEGCKKMFKNNCAMRKHMYTHGPRVHICEECGKAFLENSKLKRHQLVHTGEKRFQCTFEGCGKRFSLDFNLRTHVRIHTGEKPYVCPFSPCKKRFAQLANLKSHVLAHTRNKNTQ